MSTQTETGSLDRFFKISERGSSVTREIRGGVVTFFTMAYIIVLNPIIIAGVQDVDGNYLGGGSQAEAFALVAAGTALVAGVMSILMGAVANFPLAMAAGLGLNAFVAYSIANRMTWADAMGLVVLEGLIILVLVLTGFRKAVFDAVPLPIKTAISVGIGLFIALVGLVNAGVVRTTGNASPPIGLGIGGTLSGWPVLVFCVGLLIMLALYARGVHGAILLGILATTVIAVVVEAITDSGASGGDPQSKGWNLNVPTVPDAFVDLPDFSLLGQFSLLGSFEQVGFVTTVLLVFTLLLADFFDTMGTMTAIGAEAGLNDEDGTPEGAQRILIVDSLGAVAGGAASVSSNTAYVESASGVGDGARTGLAGIVTGLLFLLATVLSPVVVHIPNEAAVPALVLVGFLMMQQVVDIPWDDIELAIPAFLTIALMPFTYSISAGIGAGFVTYVLIKAVRGKARDVHVLMWIVAALFVLYFAIDPITGWIS
ncbi:NCS2 family permease [Mumia sp. zg.B53]|uniref:NCS2 family permease n=1 Tax=unclassified Mumia TaxID=2621872 RepID=UPI001C6F1656|nr:MULTISPECIES: NCS2 family permease [unclassified Mumia]MBW9206997.1 NCS2 family permease [Mumia sp. zg.B17]MBW9215280.1 NCS2 family permease [Mumia sp. zg.B53]MDD9348946.1 NCS2 family permease [Mumia sp.]